MSDPPPAPHRNPSWPRTLVRALAICAGAVVILLPAWLPDRPEVPIERGTVEFLQALLLALSAAVMLGASAHAGAYRPVCRVLGLALIAAFVGEIEDFLSEILGWNFPEAWFVGGILLVALVMALRHRRVMVHFLATLGNHAGYSADLPELPRTAGMLSDFSRGARVFVDFGPAAG
jgi:hypothetical protein